VDGETGVGDPEGGSDGVTLGVLVGFTGVGGFVGSLVSGDPVGV